jgi:16S rRNA G966 N2-methylase RsmD
MVLVMILAVLVLEFNIFQRLWPQNKLANGRIRDNRYLKMKYRDIEVSYLRNLNGGGILFSYEFVHVVSQKIGKVSHIFEYCAGPGFIGFNLLANHLCDRLTLAEINPKAIEAIRQTIKENNLEDKVSVYQADCLDSIPETEQWDLVVGNPPWHLSLKLNGDKRVCDPQSRVHKKFYQDIHKFLKPNGSIFFIEGGEYTKVKDFKVMIEDNSLKMVESFQAMPFLKTLNTNSEYRGGRICLLILLHLSIFVRETYFIWSKRKSSL